MCMKCKLGSQHWRTQTNWSGKQILMQDMAQPLLEFCQAAAEYFQCYITLNLIYLFFLATQGQWKKNNFSR